MRDSPARLAAWIVEKFRAWSDCGGDVESVFTMDQLLADIGLYWFTGAIGSSFWPYYARLHAPWPIPDGGVTVPMGYAAFPREILRPPRSVAEKVNTDIHRWTEMPKGGHFAAMEQPEALAHEIIEFFRPLRRDRELSASGFDRARGQTAESLAHSGRQATLLVPQAGNTCSTKHHQLWVCCQRADGQQPTRS